MKNWPTVRLAEFCEILSGGRTGITGADFIDVGIPAYGAGGINGRVAEAEFSRPGVVLSSIGARCGKCFYVEGEWATLANTQVILPDLGVADPKFLWYQLNDERSWHRSGTAQPFIKPADVKARTVVLPPIGEQRRIASILDRADALRAKRRESLALIDDLTQSLFLDMFGPNIDPGWERVPVNDLVSPVRGGIRTGPFGSQLLHSEFVGRGVAVLGIDNVVTNAFGWKGRRYITEAKYQQLIRYTVHPGDVLISIMGTCGRAAVVPDDVPLAINTKHLCCISLDQRRCVPAYLHAYFLGHPVARRYLERAAKGAIMSGLNMVIIRSMPVVLPPTELQLEFVRRMGRVTSIGDQQAESADRLDSLFASLQDRAFRGDL